MLFAHPMNRSLHVPIAPGRKLGAYVCLLTVMLLWPPLWAAVLQADGMGCCTGGFCPAHGHQKIAQAVAEHSAPTEKPMECEHDGGASQSHRGAMKCSISCCHESSNSLTAAVIYILPLPVAITLPSDTTSAPAELRATEFVQSIEPLSPPPRTLLLSV